MHKVPGLIVRRRAPHPKRYVSFARFSGLWHYCRIWENRCHVNG